MPSPEIRVEGLRELRAALAKIDPIDARKEFQAGLKAAADIVAQDAKGRVPVRTGKAAGSVRATSGGNRAFVVGGKAAVPYYGWLDFGTRTPRSGQPRSVGPWAGTGAGPAKGRFIYVALDAKEDQVVDAVEAASDKALGSLGL